MDQGFSWARLAVVAGGVVAALVMQGLVGLGAIPSAGLPATAIMVAALTVHRRPRPAGVGPGWTDPCRLIVAGTGVLALTNAGLGPGLAPVGLLAYPLLVIGLLRLQSARLPDREADVLVQAGLLATTFAIGLWVLVTPARLRLDIPLGTAEVSVALAALDLLLLTMAVHPLLLPGERLFVYRGTALALAFLFGAHLVAALALFTGQTVTNDVVSALVAVAFVLLAVSALDPGARRLFEPLIGEPARFSAAHLVLIEMGMLAPPTVIAVHAARQVAVPPAPPSARPWPPSCSPPTSATSCFSAASSNGGPNTTG